MSPSGGHNHTDSSQFERYFTLEEAVKELPKVEATLKAAWEDLAKLRSDVVLYKRLHLAKRDRPMGTDGSEMDVLRKKYNTMEEKLEAWATVFDQNHWVLRELEQGVVEFPYRAQNGDEFLLCWHRGDSGILHFRAVDDNPMMQLPITVLPD